MEGAKRLTFISKSDLKGGAAIVTYRLVEALRELGMDARMLVCEKLSKSDFVELCSSHRNIQFSFLKERMKVYWQNGRNLKTLFQIDTAAEGLPLWEHEWVKDADAVFLGWVNQGMLSFKGIRKICSMGKPVVWIMHDMWNMTGICHHAKGCTGYLNECGDCPLLDKRAHHKDLSHRIWELKRRLYDHQKIRFVAVSSWLAHRAAESKLMKKLPVAVIPNAFSLPDDYEIRDRKGKRHGPVKIIFGAARLDDPIKGLPVLKRALDVLCSLYPEVAADVELVTFGSFKHLDSLRNFAIPHVHLGMLRGAKEIRRAYEECDIVVSTSDYETLPGTLVEGQAYGCIPVAIDHGGQRDIIENLKTGWLGPWNDSLAIRAGVIAEGIAWAYRNRDNFDLLHRMRESVRKKFGALEVAQRILDFTFPPSPEE